MRASPVVSLRMPHRAALPATAMPSPAQTSINCRSRVFLAITAVLAIGLVGVVAVPAIYAASAGAP